MEPVTQSKTTLDFSGVPAALVLRTMVRTSKRDSRVRACNDITRQHHDMILCTCRHSSGSIAKLTRRLTSMSEGHSMEIDTAQAQSVPQSDALIDGFTVPEVRQSVASQSILLLSPVCMHKGQLRLRYRPIYAGCHLRQMTAQVVKN